MRFRITSHPHRSLVIGVLLLIILCYGAILSAPFVFDDTSIIGESGVVPTFSGVFSAWDYFPARFIPYVTFLINYWIGGDNPIGYHLVNVFLHVGMTLTVYWFVSLLGKKPYFNHLPWARNQIFPVAVAAIFAVHPLQTQAVTYVYQRSAVLAALFFLLSLCFFLRRRLWLSLASAACALLSKENAFILFPVVFLTQAMVDPGSFRKKETIRYVLLLALLTVGLAFLIGAHTYQDRPARGLVALMTDNTRKNPEYAMQYLLTQIPVCATYLRLLFFPVEQNVDYDYPLVHSFAEFPYPAFFLHAGILFLSILCYKKNRLIFYGVLFFYLTLALESSVIAMDDLIFEHRMYLPLVGILLAIVSAAGSISQSSRVKRWSPTVVWGMLFSVVLLLSILTIRRNLLWRDPAALWKDAAEKSPGKARVHYNLAVVYDRNDRLQEALEQYKAVLRIKPKHIEALINMGLVLERMGKFQEAEEAYVLAHAIDPNSDSLPLLNLGTLYMKQNKMDLALMTFEEVTKLHPKHPFAIYNLGLIYETLNRREEAETLYKKAQEAASGNPKQRRIIEERERNRALYYEYQNAQQGPDMSR